MLLLVAFLTLFVSGIACGAAYQTFATRRDRRNFLPPGKLIEINGKRIHYQVMGQGSPTIVVDSGQGGTHLDWQLVQPKVAKFTQIVTYDRAGYGWSDLSTEPRTTQQVVNDLRQLLQNIEISPPYILVGMSLSGIFTRYFAYQYPEEVAGIILVSVAHERMYERMPPAMIKLNQQFDWFAIHVLPIAARIGLFRLLATLDRLPLAVSLFKKLPCELQPAAKSIYAQTQFWQALGQESAAFSTSLQQIKQVRDTRSFPNIPLIVLSSGKPDFGASVALIESMQALDADLARESPQGIQIIVKQSGHAIQLDDPEQVIDAIRQVVEQVRRGFVIQLASEGGEP